MKWLAILTLDKHFQQKRLIMKNRTIKKVKDGFIFGLRNFGFYLYLNKFKKILKFKIMK